MIRGIEDISEFKAVVANNQIIGHTSSSVVKCLLYYDILPHRCMKL